MILFYNYETVYNNNIVYNIIVVNCNLKLPRINHPCNDGFTGLGGCGAVVPTIHHDLV